LTGPKSLDFLSNFFLKILLNFLINFTLFFISSVLNRSPPSLLKEIILVNDRSTKEFLYKDLKDYLKANFDHRVKLLELPTRSGLIWARLAGARAAVGDVLLFLDSHTEPNTNWLPPLLEPIAKNYRVCTCPFIDVIEFETFEYVVQDEGSRGEELIFKFSISKIY
jgi:hypothetical protein